MWSPAVFPQLPVWVRVFLSQPSWFRSESAWGASASCGLVEEKGTRCARGCLWLSLHPRSPGGAGTGSVGREGAERGPPSVIEGRRVSIKHVGDSRGAAGRSVASIEPRTGITRAPGPGCVGESPAPVCGTPACLWDLDAPGLPSRVVPLLGRPFVLTTPGGWPVAVCWFGVPLLLR